MSSLYEMLKDKPSFKAYCRRRSTQRRKTREETIADWRKKRAADFKAFCRPRGMLSILKDNEYWTGGSWGDTPLIAVLKKQGDEFISVYEAPPPIEPDEPDDDPAEMAVDDSQSPQDDDAATMALIVALEQQNALLRQLAARV